MRTDHKTQILPPDEEGCPGYPRLDDIGVLVTRPSGQSAALLDRLSSAGARALSFPLIVIEALSRPVLCSPHSAAWPGPQAGVADDAAWSKIAAAADLGVFTSANAVRHAQGPVAALRESIAAGHRCQIAAIGAATGRALREAGLAPTLMPESGSDSAALLQRLRTETVNGRRVLLVGGLGGRREIDQTLRDRGAMVCRVAVYRRDLPKVDLNAYLERHSDSIQVVLTSSGEALENLLRLTSPRWQEWLFGCPLVVSHDRNLTRSRELGFHGRIVAARSLSEDGLLQAICRVLARG